MKAALLAVAIATVVLPAPALANPITPAQLRLGAYGALALVGAIVYNNERIHHRADNAKNEEIQAALLEHRERLQAQAAAGPAIQPPTMAPRYVCVALDAAGGCSELRPG